MEKLSRIKNKKYNIKKSLLTLLILEAIGLFVIGILFSNKIPTYPFNMFAFAFQFIGLFIIISLYVLTTYFLATHKNYILPIFIIGFLVVALYLPLHLLASCILNCFRTNSFLFWRLEIYISSFIIFSSSLILYCVFPPSLMLLIFKHLKIFEKQNTLIKTMIITAMIYPLMMFAYYSAYLIFLWLSFIF